MLVSRTAAGLREEDWLAADSVEAKPEELSAGI
jgi:hypothetical protein